MARSEIPFIVQEVDGDAVEAASVQINVRGGGNPAATIFADETGGAELSNPVATDDTGRIPGWLEEGSYRITVSGTGITTYNRALEIARGDSIYGTAKLADGAVTTPKLADSGVTTVKIGAAQVTEPKLADSSVSTRTIEASAVSSAKILDTAVITAKLADDAVTQAKVADNAIGTLQLENLAVTNGKVADATLTGAKLANGTITLANLASALVNLLVPVGSILATAQGGAPSGYLLCDGAAVSRTGATLDLFNAIGTAYGVGNGSTTFNLPDLRGRVLVGVDGAAGRLASNDARGNAGGTETHTLTSSQMPVHSHTVNDPGHSHPIRLDSAIDANPGLRWGSGIGNFIGSDGVYIGHKQTGITLGNSGSGTAHNNMQPYQIGNWIIRI